MKAALIRWGVLTLAVWLAAEIIPGIHCTEWQSLLVAALVLGILNTFVKPLLVMVSFPFVVLTMGFFLLIINALLVWLTSKMVTGFQVSGFWPALGASLIISIISLLLGQDRRPRPPTMVYTEAERIRQPPPGKGPIIDV